MSFVDVSGVSEREIIPGYRVRFIHTDSMTFAYWSIDAGAPLPEHAHPHEQVANVLSGQYELTVNGESKLLKPGEVAVIPSGAPHSGVAVTDCRILDVFCPVREDYR